jgi:hypothetical protein
MRLIHLIALALVASLAARTQPAASAPKKIQTLLITGQNGHDWQTVSPLLKKQLEATGRFEVRMIEEFRGGGPETLAPYDLVVLNYYERRDKNLWWGERAQNALLDFVKSGKGLVMYHFSIAAFDGWEEYEKLSGANWRPNQGHHSPPHDFTVKITDREHPITKGLRAQFRQWNDELYANLKWQPQGAYHVLATAWDDHKLYQGKARQPIPGDGIDQPMLWTLNYGQGRVFTTVLGHDGAAVQTPGFVTTFTRGAEWAATGAVTLPIPDSMRERVPGERRERALPKDVTPGTNGSAPSDAVVLFNGRDMTGWESDKGGVPKCQVGDGAMACRTGVGNIYTTEKFKSAQFHLEFMPPVMADQKDQLKGNSGVYLQGITEIQILDSYQNPTYPTGYLGAIYDQHPPLVNAARKPGEWQSYDIVYHAPVCDSRGNVIKDSTVTVLLNGVLIQDNAPVSYRKGMCEAGPLLLQDHSGFPGAPDTTMRFRNVWARRLD